jgi:hypothetical protein
MFIFPTAQTSVALCLGELLDRLRLLEMFVHFDMHSFSDEHKPRMLVAATGREVLVRYAGDFMLLIMSWVMNHLVNPRIWNFVAWLKLFPDGCHFETSYQL